MKIVIEVLLTKKLSSVDSAHPFTLPLGPGGFVIINNPRLIKKFIFLLLYCSYPACFADALDSLKSFSTNEFSSLLSSVQGDTAITPPPEVHYADSATIKLSVFYSEWNSQVNRSCLSRTPLTTTGFTVDSSEIEHHLSLYTKAFPDIFIDTFSIYSEIILEKYLSEKLGIVPSPQQLGMIYQWYVEQTPTVQHPTITEMTPILNCRVMLASDTVAKLCKELQEKQEKIFRQQNAKINDNWPYKDISLKADPELCLAKDPEKDTCLVTVGELNGSLLITPFRRYVHPDSARSMALVRLLMNYFLAAQAKEKVLEGKKDLFKIQNHGVEQRLYQNKYPSLLDTTYSEEVLSATYKKYYDRFFCDKNIRKVELVGSSDSLFIDSLYRLYSRLETENSQTNFSGKKKFMSSLSWLVTSANMLPAILQQAIDTMKFLTMYKIETPFGHFLCRVVVAKRRLKMSYEEAGITVRYLVNEDRIRAGGRLDSTIAKEYYKNNALKFVTPDTLLCRAWLIPLIDTSAFSVMDTTRQLECMRRDTARFKSISISTNKLPAEIAADLLMRYQQTGNKNKLFGPLSGRYGTWYFIVNKATSGGKRLPFAAVKDSILKQCQVQTLPLDSIAETQAGARFLKNTILAGAYTINLYEEMKSITNDDILKLIKNGQLKMAYANNKKPDDSFFALARERILQTKFLQNEQNQFKWIKSLSIDKALLFKGTASLLNK